MVTCYHVFKMLQQERDSATKQKSSFDALVKELEDFRHTIHSESGAFTSKRRRQSQSGGRAIKGTRPARYDTISPSSMGTSYTDRVHSRKLKTVSHSISRRTMLRTEPIFSLLSCHVLSL